MAPKPKKPIQKSPPKKLKKPSDGGQKGLMLPAPGKKSPPKKGAPKKKNPFAK